MAEVMLLEIAVNGAAHGAVTLQSILIGAEVHLCPLCAELPQQFGEDQSVLDSDLRCGISGDAAAEGTCFRKNMGNTRFA